MKPLNEQVCTAFRESKLIASGKMVDVALAAKQQLDKNSKIPVLIFDDSTGQQIEFDFRGSEEKFLARLKAMVEPASQDVEPKAGPGRPKLGVVSREIGLLPRHWEWLAKQPEGASSVLRKLVEDAQKKNASRDELRRIQEAAYRFMTIMAGDLPDFEEALRAFYAKDKAKFAKLIGTWPKDIREHAMKLAKPALSN